MLLRFFIGIYDLQAAHFHLFISVLCDCYLLVRWQDASAWMIDNIGFSRHDYWRSESESIDLQSHWRKAGYANIASVDFIQIQVKIEEYVSKRTIQKF